MNNNNKMNNNKYQSKNYQIYIINLIIDILKSVYELRKSHAALANRPVTS
jgi:hypothetical protein